MSEEFGIWGATAPAAPAAPQLEGALECEIAIVGAGYTGLSTALHLAERGTVAVVLEAHEPGYGASGRNTGWLEPNWWLKTPAQIEAMFGAERGRALTRWVSQGPALLDAWIDRYGMSIGIERGGMMLATDDPRKAAAFEAEARQWQAAGVDHQFLDAPAIARHVATDRYLGALFLRTGATLDPLALSRELARACIGRGVRLFCRSPVARIERSEGHWRLEVRGHTVRCRQLVLATDAYTGALWPALARAYAKWEIAVVASEPYAPLGSLLPTRVAFADMDLSSLFTVRGAAGRLVASTFAPLGRSMSASEVAGPYARKFAQVFAGAPLPQWRYVHFGTVGVSRDMMPHLAAIGPQAWTAFGYSGTGINLALLLGGELARLVETDSADAASFPVTRLEPFALRTLVGWGLRYLHAPLSRALVARRT